MGAFEDPTVRGARLVPEKLDPSVLTGTEPDGSKRGILAGFRVLAMPDGAILVSDDRLAQTPQSALAVPPRLGGGYLHLVGQTLLRSESWLSEVKPIYVAGTNVHRVFAGLDRVYVRTQQGHVAIDARTGAVKELGPFPPGPQLVSYGARDGWRAAAIGDLVGLMTTDDAGATWRKLDLGIDPRSVSVNDSGKLIVSGLDGSRGMASFELREGGQSVRIGQAPRPGANTKKSKFADKNRDRDREPELEPEVDDAAIKPPEVRAFGPRPLLAALEDGWPLTDGVALVARDGALARVRLEDGAMLEAVPGAFPLSPARCHGISLTRPEAKGAFGFVCGEPRGRTDLYAYDPAKGKLALLRRFDKPRVVVSSGNGALAVRGSCAPGDVAEVDKQRTYCVLDYQNRFREVHVRGDVGNERLTVLADRRIAILSPPSGEVTTARLTLLEASGAARTIPLVFPRVAADVARALRYGVWLEGVEERRPGVLGAWVDAGGSVLGLEIGIDGNVKVGQYVHDAGFPTVAGRYGFGYTNARRLFETSDGGMTWQSVEAPEPLVSLSKVTSRAVGPLGAAGAGWLRVGWGPREKKNEKNESAAPEAARPKPRAIPSLNLLCEPMAPTPKIPPSEHEPSPKAAKPASGGKGVPTIRLGGVNGGPFSPFGGGPFGGGMRFPSDLTPFYASAPPKIHDGERPMLNTDIYDSFDHIARGAPLGKVYGWGPKTPDPDPQSRFQVRWLSPFDGYGEVHSTAPSALPAAILEAMRGGTAGMYGSSFPGVYNSTWIFGGGDDGAHAMVGTRSNNRQGVTLWELEADRGPLTVRRSDGEDFGEIESVVRVQGKWVVSTQDLQNSTSGIANTLLFVIDGGTARPLARIPRASGSDTARLGGKLARRSDGRGVGYLVDASGPGSRGQTERWVLPVDLESGALGEPMSLGAADYSDHPPTVCAGEEPGYIVDLPFSPNALRFRTPSGNTQSLTSSLVRMRLSSTQACLEAAAGTVTASDDKPVSGHGKPGGRAGNSTLRVTAFWSGMRYPLSCTAAP